MNGFIILSKSVGIPVLSRTFVPNFGLPISKDISSLSLSGLLFALQANAEDAFSSSSSSSAVLKSFNFGGTELDFFTGHLLDPDMLCVVFISKELLYSHDQNRNSSEYFHVGHYLASKICHHFIKWKAAYDKKMKEKVAAQVAKEFEVKLKQEQEESGKHGLEFIVEQEIEKRMKRVAASKREFHQFNPILKKILKEATNKLIQQLLSVLNNSKESENEQEHQNSLNLQTNWIYVVFSKSNLQSDDVSSNDLLTYSEVPTPTNSARSNLPSSPSTLSSLSNPDSNDDLDSVDLQSNTTTGSEGNIASMSPDSNSAKTKILETKEDQKEDLKPKRKWFGKMTTPLSKQLGPVTPKHVIHAFENDFSTNDDNLLILPNTSRSLPKSEIVPKKPSKLASILSFQLFKEKIRSIFSLKKKPKPKKQEKKSEEQILPITEKPKLVKNCGDIAGFLQFYFEYSDGFFPSLLETNGVEQALELFHVAGQIMALVGDSNQFMELAYPSTSITHELIQKEESEEDDSESSPRKRNRSNSLSGLKSNKKPNNPKSERISKKIDFDEFLPLTPEKKLIDKQEYSSSSPDLSKSKSNSLKRPERKWTGTKFVPKSNFVFPNPERIHDDAKDVFIPSPPTVPAPPLAKFRRGSREVHNLPEIHIKVEDPILPHLYPSGVPPPIKFEDYEDENKKLAILLQQTQKNMVISEQKDNIIITSTTRKRLILSRCNEVIVLLPVSFSDEKNCKNLNNSSQLHAILEPQLKKLGSLMKTIQQIE